MTSIIIVDFGSQSTHLISRRLKSIGVTSTIINPEKSLEKIKKLKPNGIVLSGGPSSVYENNSPTIDKKIFSLGTPILGICYGLQLTAHLLGGKVVPGSKKELGPASLQVTKSNLLFSTLPKEFGVWMSHGDHVSTLPTGFTNIAKTNTIKNGGFANISKKIYGIQFHPEIIHTQYGTKILSNFAEIICGLKLVRPKPTKETIKEIVSSIKTRVGDKSTAICALSGGVDSSVAATLVALAMGKRLVCIYIDSGLMRHGETESIKRMFKPLKLNLKIVTAKNIFLSRLKNVSDPETKRKIIGKTFIDILEKEALKTNASYLVQGTIYPDVIESQGTKHSQKIKSHHNVGGLPKNMKLKLIEPLRELYKDEVRELGIALKLPQELIQRQPYPGPGLAIRIIGDVTERKVNIVRQADFIMSEELKGIKIPIWQAAAIFAGVRTTGIKGDARVYGETIALRAVQSLDMMSVHWAPIPHAILDKIAIRIVNEIKEVNRVVYDITNKPPGTFEWE